MTNDSLPKLCDRKGNAILRIAGEQILDVDGNVLAIVEQRTARSVQGEWLGRVTPQGRLAEGAPSEVVVVVEQLRDVMGRPIGRFVNATPEQRGLLALVYGQFFYGHSVTGTDT